MRRLFTFSLFALLLTACGQAGPLYLPGSEQPDNKPAAAQPDEAQRPADEVK